MLSPQNTRRWPRHTVDLPVNVEFQAGTAKTVAPGRGIEISEGGMALYAGIQLKPHDVVEVEFQTPWQARVAGVVRNRTGCCFGVEFLSPLSFDSETSQAAPARSARLTRPDRGAEDAIAVSLRMRDLYLHQRRVEIQRMQNDLRALRQVSGYLARLETQYAMEPAAARTRRDQAATRDNPLNMLSRLLKAHVGASLDIRRGARTKKIR